MLCFLLVYAMLLGFLWVHPAERIRYRLLQRHLELAWFIPIRSFHNPLPDQDVLIILIWHIRWNLINSSALIPKLLQDILFRKNLRPILLLNQHDYKTYQRSTAICSFDSEWTCRLCYVLLDSSHGNQRSNWLVSGNSIAIDQVDVLDL